MSDDSSAITTLFRETGINILGIGIGFAVGFLVRIILARGLGKSTYGVVALGITMLTVASAVSVVGLDQGISRYLPRKDDELFKRRVVTSGFLLGIPTVLMVTAGILVFAESISSLVFGNPENVRLVQLFGLAVPFAVMVKLSIGTIRGMKYSTPKVYIQHFLIPVGTLGLSIVAIAAGFSGIGVAGAYLVTYATAAIIGLYYVGRLVPARNFAYSGDLSKKLLRHSAPLLAASLSYTIFTDIDTLMLGYFTTSAIVGEYQAVYPLSRSLTMVLSGFGFIVLPILSELDVTGSSDDWRQIYHIAIRWSLLLSAPIFGLLLLFPETIISLTFGSEYATAGLVLSVLSIGFFFHSAFGISGPGLQAVGETQALMIHNLIVAVLNVLLNLLLIPRFSLLGAAVATTLSYGCLDIFHSYRLYKTMDALPIDVRTIKSLFPVTVSGALLYHVVIVIFGSGVIGAVIWAVAFGLSAVFLFAVTGGFSRELELLAEYDGRITNQVERVLARIDSLNR